MAASKASGKLIDKEIKTYNWFFCLFVFFSPGGKGRIEEILKGMIEEER